MKKQNFTNMEDASAKELLKQLQDGFFITIPQDDVYQTFTGYDYEKVELNALFHSTTKTVFIEKWNLETKKFDIIKSFENLSLGSQQKIITIRAEKELEKSSPKPFVIEFYFFQENLEELEQQFFIQLSGCIQKLMKDQKFVSATTLTTLKIQTGITPNRFFKLYALSENIENKDILFREISLLEAFQIIKIVKNQVQVKNQLNIFD